MSDTALEYLVGSTTRPDTLVALRDHGVLSIRGLEEQVSASRRTLKRTLGAMESRGWVRPLDGGYELTSLGAAMLSAYERCREHERVAQRFRTFLEHTPGTAFDLDVEALAEATLVDANGDPAAPIDRLLDLRADAARLRECAPYLLLDTVHQLADRVTDERPPPDVTLVLGDATPTPEAYTPEYCERFDALAAAPSVDIYAYPGDVELPVGIADGRAFAGAMNADGMPIALLEADGGAVVDWAERTFERYLAASDPV